MTIYRATVSGTLFGQVVQNVMHFRRFEPPPDAPAVLAQRLIDGFYGQIRLFCSNQMNWNQVRVDTIEDPPPLPTIVTTNFSGSWTSTSVLWGPMTVVFQIRTPFPGRKGRGRWYISGVDAAAVQSGFWNAGQQGLHNSVANSLKSQFIGPPPSSDYELGVFPRGSLDPTDFKVANNIVARPLPGTQTRRNIGRGK